MPTHVQFIQGGGFYPVAVCAFVPGSDLATLNAFYPKITVHGPFGEHEIVATNVRLPRAEAITWAEAAIRKATTPDPVSNV